MSSETQFAVSAVSSSTAEPAVPMPDLNVLQKARTRRRLMIGRIFGVVMLGLLLSASNFWDESGRPLVGTALFAAGLTLTVIGFLGRFWSLLHIGGRKKRTLVTGGPYSLCRHPLYFFTYIGGLGICLTTRTFAIPLLFTVAFALYYRTVIRSEERFLHVNFAGYGDYSRQTPTFFPKWRLPEGELVIDTRVLYRELVTTALFLISIAVLELIRELSEALLTPTFFTIL
jgi:protein-S-isoprenylcysteine O-methyltransferase Ste14